MQLYKQNLQRPLGLLILIRVLLLYRSLITHISYTNEYDLRSALAYKHQVIATKILIYSTSTIWKWNRIVLSLRKSYNYLIPHPRSTLSLKEPVRKVTLRVSLSHTHTLYFAAH